MAPRVAVALLLVIAALFVAADGPSDDVEAQSPLPAASEAIQPEVLSPRVAYRRARAKGQPIAVIERATELRASPGGRVLARLGRSTEFDTPRVLAVVGQRRGWLRVMATELPNGGTGWIAGRDAGIAASPWAVRADLSRHEVTVLRRGRVVRRFSVAIGRAATPTPTGRFAVTDKLHIKGGSRAYGCCALALSGHQPHIEPGWQGGDRLAIHGTALPGSIGTAASFGCLRARESDVRWLVHHVWLGSIVTIRP